MASNKATMKKGEPIDNLFHSYVNRSLGMIDPEGIETLCSDLGVDHTDVRILMLAWKMNAQKQGYFTQETQYQLSCLTGNPIYDCWRCDPNWGGNRQRLADCAIGFSQDEWQRGLKALTVDTVNKLKNALSELENEVRMPQNFADFYSFAFQYCLTEDKQKWIDVECICELLDIVMGSQFLSQVALFTKFLKIQNDYKVINMDQWTSFLQFCRQISFPDLKNYDTTEAWPLILDDFVEWMREEKLATTES
ncbi:unnamed protein product [Camellia sinensis]